MSVLAVITWFVTICFGLFLLGIWLVEYDRDSHRATATRLPVPVLSAHALLAVAGLPIWLVYLVTDDHKVAWTAAIILACVAVLGLTMVFRWLGVYRAHRAPGAAETVPATMAFVPRLPPELPAAPAERNFPIVVVLTHGFFALVTIALVWLTAFGIGRS
jgi:hypothetical protein